VTCLRVVVEVVADFRADSDFLAAVRKRLADDLLARAVTVDVASIEEGDSLIDSVAHHFDRLLFSAVAPPVGADDPRTEADFTHFDAALSERSVVHRCPLEVRILSACGYSLCGNSLSGKKHYFEQSVV